MLENLFECFCKLLENDSNLQLFFTFLKDFVHLSLRDGEGRGKRGRETSIGCLWYTPWLGTEPATQACVLMGVEPFALWDCAQPTEPHHLGQSIPFLFKKVLDTCHHTFGAACPLPVLLSYLIHQTWSWGFLFLTQLLAADAHNHFRLFSLSGTPCCLTPFITPYEKAANKHKAENFKMP